MKKIVLVVLMALCSVSLGAEKGLDPYTSCYNKQYLKCIGNKNCYAKSQADESVCLSDCASSAHSTCVGR